MTVHLERPLLIVGAGVAAEEIADLAGQIEGVEIAGFVEGLDRERCAAGLLGLPVHWVDDLAPLAETHCAVGAVGSTRRAGFIGRVEEQGLPFATLVHPSAEVAPSATLGRGTVVGVRAVIASHTRIGRHVYVNRGALIGHHDTIGDFVTIAPGANIAGKCTIGERVYVGMGSTVVDHTVVGERSVIGAGAVVVRDVPPRVQVVGVPARVVRTEVDGL